MYRLKCNDCEKVYIGETGRTADKRAREHASYARNGRFDMSAAAEHAIFNQHSLDLENPQVIDHETGPVRRRVREEICIYSEKNSMNKDKGLQLDPIWFSLF